MIGEKEREEKKISESKEDPNETSNSPSVTSTIEVEEQRYNSFLQWMQSHGAKFPHLTLRRYAVDYRGVHVNSKNEIAKGKTILRIPHKLLITVELAKASPIGRAISSISSLGSQAILALYLLAERQKGAYSFWKLWLDVMPQSFSTLPMFFSNDELALLNGCTDLLLKVKSQQKSMREEYASIAKLKGVMTELPNFSYDDFVWACLAVGTRVFSLCINGSKTSVLAPFADMMNHKNPAGTNWTYDGKKQSFTLTSCCALRDGDAVYESYGVKDNKRFFASYGFCLDDNSANEVTLCIRSGSEGQAQSVRQFVVRASYDNALEEVMSYMRCFSSIDTSSDQSLSLNSLSQLNYSNYSSLIPTSAYDRTSSYLRSYPGPFSIENEISALQYLQQACEDHLNAYDSTLEEDAALLETAALKKENMTNVRNCLIFRMGEQRIFRWIIDWSTQMINILSSPPSNATNTICRLLDSPPSAFILNPVVCPQGQSAEQSMATSCISYLSSVVNPLFQALRQRSLTTHILHNGSNNLESDYSLYNKSEFNSDANLMQDENDADDLCDDNGMAEDIYSTGKLDQHQYSAYAPPSDNSHPSSSSSKRRSSLTNANSVGTSTSSLPPVSRQPSSIRSFTTSSPSSNSAVQRSSQASSQSVSSYPRNPAQTNSSLPSINGASTRPRLLPSVTTSTRTSSITSLNNPTNNIRQSRYLPGVRHNDRNSINFVK